ncbi:putative disease resistance protein RDL5/RF45 [Actinoplanes sp. SE50/110]|nr:putative disease resistance protein RDL5/RF45 [Actinoplanes sp. SE50/110]
MTTPPEPPPLPTAQALQLGAHNVQYNFSGGAVPVTWPCRAGVVPPEADCRQSRPADQTLARPSASREGTVAQVVTGMGGVGKTQLVAHLAHDLWRKREVDLLVWITATSRRNLVAGYAEAALRVFGIEEGDVDRAAQRFLTWLAEPHGHRWLIVLDDVSDPADLRYLWPPAEAFGRTVVTSRRRDNALWAGRQLIELTVFRPAEAEVYLKAKLAARPAALDGAADLAAALGHHPLALAQAAAYILDRGPRTSCSAYRKLLTGRRRRLSDLAPDALPDQQGVPMSAIWTLSIEQAARLAPVGLAQPVLELAALLDPNGIPISILTTTSVSAFCAERVDREIDADTIDEALRLLARFNLLSLDDATETAHIHAMVQRAVRETLTPDARRRLSTCLADAVFEQWRTMRRREDAMAANVIALVEATDLDLWDPEGNLHPVLYRTLHRIAGEGEQPSTSFLDHLYRRTVEHVGIDHLSTLRLRIYLAVRRGASGDMSGAVDDFEALVGDCVRTLGQDHDETLNVRRNLGEHKARAGDTIGGIADLEAVLVDCLRIQGADHPNTLGARFNLAKWRGHTGDPLRSAGEFDNLVAALTRELGPDDSNTLAARWNAASFRGMAGEGRPAVEMFTALTRDYVRLAGRNHPVTLEARLELAKWRAVAGDTSDAIADLRALVEDMVRVLGADHAQTRKAQDDLDGLVNSPI